MRRRLVLPVGALALAAAALAGAGPLDGLQRVRLDNGLTVLLLPDHSAPLVSVAMMYAAGARNEGPGQTGIAHFVEHMAFRASARFPGSENTEAITRIGGRWNGYTWLDQTYYAATAGRDALGLLLDIEADRMSGAVFDAAEFEKERQSVIAELHSYDDPHSLLYDAVLAASFHLHPYRHNTIGWLSDVEQLTRDEAYAFYRRFYTPDNAVLVVAGDVAPEAALAEVKRRFGGIARGKADGSVRTAEPPQQGQRRLVLRRPGPHAEVLLAWRAPALTDPDFPAMVAFDALLAGGKGFRFTTDYASPDTAPLQRALVGAGLASRAASDWQASRYPYVYTLSAATPEADGLGAAEAALWRALEEAAARDWTAAELAAARRQVHTGWAADLDDLAGRAHQLAFFEVSGGAEWLQRLPALLDQVTADDVRSFARRRLGREQATVGWFAPGAAGEPEAAKAAPPASAAAPVVPGATLPAPPQRDAPTPASTVALANGVTARIVPRSGAGLAALRARVVPVPARSAADRALLALLAERLGRTAPGEPAAPAAFALTLHDDPADAGNARWIEMSAEVLAEDLPALLGVLAQRLAHARTPVGAGEWPALVEGAAERARENGGSGATRLWARALAELYPAGSAAAEPAWSSAEALAGVAPGALDAYAAASLQPPRLHLALAGAVDAEAVRPLLERHFSAPGGGRQRPVVSDAGNAVPARGRARWTEVLMAEPEDAQNELLVLVPLPAQDAAERAATDALLYLLGETGYAGRLGRALVAPGLVYHVQATREEPSAPGFLAIRTAAARGHTRAVLDAIRAILDDAARGTFTAAELAEAKAYLRGRDALERAGSRSAAAASLREALEPRGFDRQLLTLEQLNAAARGLHSAGAPLALILGPGY